MVRIPRPHLLTVVVLAVLVGLPAFIYYVIYDHQNEPFCHKSVMIGIINYLDDKKTDVLPNVDGHSSDSIVLMHQYWGDDPAWEQKYRYLPGLKQGDPGDLVLMYMAAPTRYIFHGYPQTIFADKKWLLIPLDFAQGGDFVGNPVVRDMPLTGECCERVSLDELRARVKKTLDFLRDHDRPNWQTVVAEQERFLASFTSTGQ